MQCTGNLGCFPQGKQAFGIIDRFGLAFQYQLKNYVKKNGKK